MKTMAVFSSRRRFLPLIMLAKTMNLFCWSIQSENRRVSAFIIVSRQKKNYHRHRLLSATTTTSSLQHTVSSVDENSIPDVPRKFIPFPFSYHQEVDVKIESLTNRGWGVARINIDAEPSSLTPPPPPPPTTTTTTTTTTSSQNEETTKDIDESSLIPPRRSWVVMVPNVIPGERVVARIFRNYRSYSEADLVEVVEASPDRIVPPCSLASECGGCQYQHITISRQRDMKTQHATEAYQQFSGGDGDDSWFPDVRPCLGTEHILHYRSKLTPHYAQAGAAVGFQKQTSRQVIPVESCLIATHAVNEKYQQMRQDLLQAAAAAKISEAQRRKQDDSSQEEVPTLTKKQKKKLTGATLFFRQGNLDDPYIATSEKETIHTTVHNIDFYYQAGNFFQNNYYVLPMMVDLVLDQATRVLPNDNNTAAGSRPTHFVDCYCGSGLFALSCAHAFDKVIGIEINTAAVAEATHNADINKIPNVSFVAATAETIFESIQGFPRHETVVIVDPPRKGCSEEFLALLFDFAPARIVYMSCDVVTQARDARMIVDAGYSCTSIQPIDLFPQTRHIESLAVFEKHR
jgi:23S rRNA (uracil1939-C5)-methyltransferase/tRNA (uracil-5-)-methyltransferase